MTTHRATHAASSLLPLLGALATACAQGSGPTDGADAQVTSSGGRGGDSASSVGGALTVGSGGHASGAGGAAGGDATGTGAGGGSLGCVEADGLVLAVEQLQFGISFGFDLDAAASSPSELCQPNSGASFESIHAEEPSGVDNSFSKTVLGLFSWPFDWLAKANQPYFFGVSTMLVKLDGLALETHKAPLDVKIYRGAQVLSPPPAFDGTDCWPVAPESLVDPVDIESAALVFQDGALADNSWTGESAGSIELLMGSFDKVLHLEIRNVRLSLDLAGDHQSATAFIGGVLDTEALLTEVERFWGEEGYCDAATVDQLTQVVRQASDIMNDATQDPSAVCNGISIGLGLKLKRVDLGGIAPPEDAPTSDPCARP